MELKFSRQIFEKYANIKFNENPSSGKRVVPCGQTDMTKPIVTFRNNLQTRLKIGRDKNRNISRKKCAETLRKRETFTSPQLVLKPIGHQKHPGTKQE
jgi:hypothetical protein